MFDPPICPYCGCSSIFQDRHPKTSHPAWVCTNYPECDAYVGCHPGGKPLGTLADKTLRRWRNNAHAVFDPIWKQKTLSRSQAYKWLSDKLKINRSDCHIGHFSIEQCQQVIQLSLKFRGIQL